MAKLLSEAVSPSHPISLHFGPEVREPIRSRIEYAFRVFGAIYNHAIVEEGGSTRAIRCYYGQTPPPAGDTGLFYIPALYRESSFDGKRGPAKHRYAGEDIYLSCGLDAVGDQPDWLGEIFLWLSCSYEKAIASRDDVGRISCSEMIFCREGLSPQKPYAAMLMAWLENALYHGNREEALPAPPSPVSGVDHLVVCTHDVDFYYMDRSSATVRLVKNLAIAIVNYRSWSFFIDNFRMMLQLLTGRRVGEFLPALVQAADAEGDFKSTLFVIPRQSHRRDANYRLEQIAGQLRNAAEKGFAVGVHGSYRSVSEDRSLAEEARALSDAIGKRATTTRQHWLRFSEHQALFDEIERAGLIADSTLGFSGTVGFRNGACFAFPPYDFARERPHRFLEIPLVLMDVGLEAAARGSRTAPQKLAEEVLGESRKYGWGGISVLWHDPIEPLSVPEEINGVFWNCAKQKKDLREKWVSADDFLSCCIERYHKAGLLGSSPTAVKEENLVPSEFSPPSAETPHRN
jgi:hypothetical protein